MKVYYGNIASDGIAIGKIKKLGKNCSGRKQVKISDTIQEEKRLQEAIQKVGQQLKVLYEETLEKAGKEHADIFAMHQVMMNDKDYLAHIQNCIEEEKESAEAAVQSAEDYFCRVFEQMQDEYMRARAIDIRDISQQLTAALTNQENSVYFDEPVIIAAEDLTPSQTMKLNKDMVLAFVVKYGSSNSHTAILARMLQIPAVVGIDFDMNEVEENTLACVNGSTGAFVLSPDEEMLKKMEEMALMEKKKREILKEQFGKDTVTPDGKKIMLYANIGDPSDLKAVQENDAEGIGLYRSEFLYLQRDDYPTEEEQFQNYKQAAEAMGQRKVIIRTMDIGADKKEAYFKLNQEENPALGYRAIRICLDREELFRTQIRAILRASAYGNMAIMYPMIISTSEIDRIKEIVAEVREELILEGTAVGNLEQGIMIETPAAVMMSRELARKVDFFSIGTNDLTQYTLAVDRQNPDLEKLYDPHHPAVLKMIRMTIENAHKENCWVGICGELAADLSMTETFLNMDVDELSVSPCFLLEIRKKIRETKR